MKILADTSIWIEFLKDRNYENSDRFYEAILQDTICICPQIVQEILQGCRDFSEFKQIDEKLSGLIHLQIDPYEAAKGAANLFFQLRKKGVTIRKSNDCLIAWYAMKFEVEVWHKDRDFSLIAKYTALKILK